MFKDRAVAVKNMKQITTNILLHLGRQKLTIVTIIVFLMTQLIMSHCLVEKDVKF